MGTYVSEVQAAAAPQAIDHFTARLAFETDCWDVNASLGTEADFVLLDVRGRAAFDKAHLPGAINLPYAEISEARLADWPPRSLFVVYCAGPHCNGANKAALRLARLGRPVKEMIGGMTGWADEGFAFCSTH